MVPLSFAVKICYHFPIIRVDSEEMRLPDDLFSAFIAEHFQKLAVDIDVPVASYNGDSIIGVFYGRSETIL